MAGRLHGSASPKVIAEHLNHRWEGSKCWPQVVSDRKVLDGFETPQTDPNSSGPAPIFILVHDISQFTPPDNEALAVGAVPSHTRIQRVRHRV